jgi:hypothetical protein
MIRLSSILFATLLLSSAAHADTLRLEVGVPLARFAMLRPETHRYVRYTVAADGARKLIDFWQRTLSFAVPGPGQEPALHIVQRWDEVDGKTVLVQDSWFDPNTFKPRTHIRRLQKDGKTSLAGFAFTDTRVLGMDDLAGNDRKDFVMPLAEPSYNFEYDMELLQALPLASSRTFNIPFYDAGVDKPDRYNFVVAGSARIVGPDSRLTDCWVVTADYNTGKIVSRFWFAKTGQVLIREEAMQPDGTLLVKALLPQESDDVHTRSS